jgi:hypothetical protein
MMDTGGDAGSRITGASLALGQTLTMNYYVTSNVALDNLTMRFNFGGEVTLVEGVLDEESGEYVFSLRNIPPQCMTDNIRAELIAEYANGTREVVALKTDYSIRQYLQGVMNAHSDDKALTTLVRDLVAYGRAAQDYSKYYTTGIVDQWFYTRPSNWEDVTATDFTLTDSTREDIRFSAAGVRFDYINRIFFKIKADDLNDVTITVNGRVYAADEVYFVEYTKNTYIFYTVGIYADEFDKVFTAELSVGDEVVQTLTYSVKSYVYSKQNSENIETAELVKALYNYGRSVIAYLAEQK